MNTTDHDPVLAALAGLEAPAPAGVSKKVFTGWLTAPSRIGEMFVAITEHGVQLLRSAQSVHDDPAVFAETYRARFARPLRALDHAPAGLLPALRGGRGAPELDLSDLSEFERAVLSATRAIPTGETRPYTWIARQAGRPRAVRASASVLARNPVPLLVPCHRVTRTDGALGEYLFGPDRKEELLRGEGANLDQLATLAARGAHYLGSDTTGVVCLPTCHQARRITPAHRREFRTATEATQAGYRPCGHCQPIAG
jgi:O-6-methylguanine DNA methyltransferase